MNEFDKKKDELDKKIDSLLDEIRILKEYVNGIGYGIEKDKIQNRQKEIMPDGINEYGEFYWTSMEPAGVYSSGDMEKVYEKIKRFLSDDFLYPYY